MCSKFHPPRIFLVIRISFFEKSERREKGISSKFHPPRIFFCFLYFLIRKIRGVVMKRSLRSPLRPHLRSLRSPLRLHLRRLRSPLRPHPSKPSKPSSSPFEAFEAFVLTFEAFEAFRPSRPPPPCPPSPSTLRRRLRTTGTRRWRASKASKTLQASSQGLHSHDGKLGTLHAWTLETAEKILGGGQPDPMMDFCGLVTESWGAMQPRRLERSMNSRALAILRQTGMMGSYMCRYAAEKVW